MVVNVHESINYEVLFTHTHCSRNLECLSKAFYDGSDELQVFILNQRGFTAKQSGRSLSKFYGEDYRDKVIMKDPNDITTYWKSIE